MPGALSDAALTRSSSEAILQRGRQYASSGAVEIVSIETVPMRGVRARVAGTEAYTTEVWVDDDQVAALCTCPYAAEGRFCKHQLAVALVWRGGATRSPLVFAAATDDDPSTSLKPARPAQDKRSELLEFLRAQDVSALAGKLIELADRDRHVASDLQRWRKLVAASASGTDLKPVVTELLSTGREFIAWNESRAYVQRAEAVLPLLRLAIERDAGKAAPLCLHALRRAWRAVENADDSNGDIGEFCAQVGTEWVRALEAAGPQPAKFGETYLQIQLDSPFDCFDATAAENAIGEAALKRYRSVVAERWRDAKDAVRALKAERAAQAPLRKELIESIKAREAPALGWRRRPGLHSPATAGARDVTLHAAILCSEQKWLEASALVEPPSECRDEIVARIARHLPSEENDRAVLLLQRVFEQAMHGATSPYHDQVALVREIAVRMDPPRRVAWLDSLRTEFKAKRNFVRELPGR